MKTKCILFILCCLISAGISAGDWHSFWISAEPCQSLPNTWLNFRKTCILEDVPASVPARIAVDSKYWLWINGELAVFEGGLKRGPDPHNTYYDELDLSPFLKPGKNCIAVLVWYFGKQGFSHSSSGKAGLLFEADLGNDKIISDNSWKCSLNEAFMTCDAPYPNYRLPESSILYDARKTTEGWYGPDFDDRSMAGAQVLAQAGEAPWNELVKRPIPLWKDLGIQSYIDIEKRGDTLVCRLPYNAQVTPWLKVKSSEGARIIMGTDNYFIYNGNTTNLRAEYITRDGVQSYENPGWMNGHSMYYIIPDEVDVLELGYRETGYDTSFDGYFRCSDEFLNNLWLKSLRTLYVTMRDTYMDCPDRERAQWTGDAVNQSGESFYAFSSSSHLLSRKWLRELGDWQKPDGSLFAPIPAGNWTSELPGQVMASVGYFGLWNYYIHTGDKETLAYLYPKVKKYLTLWSFTPEQTLIMREGGWLWGDWGDHRDIVLLMNAWYYLALKGMYESAVVLDEMPDAREFSVRMESLKKAFNKEFWTGSAYRNPHYNGKTDDRVQALAVVSGLADKDKYKLLLKVFQTENHASPYMEKYIFEAMMQMGYEQEALERHKIRMQPMVDYPGFTTLFEHFDIGINGFSHGSVNHSWTGGGLTVASQYICGISPLAAGYETIRIMPQPGNLAFASAGISSVRGMITSSFRNEGKEFVLDVSGPMDSEMVVGVPAKRVKEVWINDALVWKNGKYAVGGLYNEYRTEGVKHITFVLPGGTYNVKAIK